MHARKLLIAAAAAALFVAGSADVTNAAKVIAPNAAPLTIDMHQGRLIRLDRPAAGVFIADPAIADVQVKSPQIIYIFGKAAGETSLYAVDQDDKVIVGMPITVSLNIDRLREAISSATGGATVNVRQLGDSVVIEGTVRDPLDAEEARKVAAGFAGEEKVINRLKVLAPTQVNLRVRVAEVRRDITKRFGISWDLLADVGNFSFGLAQGSSTVLSGQTFPGGTLRRGTDGANAVYGLLSGGGIDLNTIVDALEDERLLTVLAEPNLTAMSGESASFLAGGEFPIPVPQDGGTISIEYKKFGVSLAFKPTVLSDGRINLSVTPEVSELSAAGSITIDNFVIPALSTRRAETTVELGSGQSFAIAGLLQSSQDQTTSKFPALGDLPVLGPLFRSDVYQRGETELVIIVTPYVVRPVSQKMALPTDGLVPPNDYERIFGNKAAFDSNQVMSNPQQRPENNLPGQRRLAGPYGFVLQ